MKTYELYHLFPAKFIQNYTESALERHLRSESPKSSCGTMLPGSDVCVQEVTSQTFHSVVMQPEKVNCFLCFVFGVYCPT